jgi:hypothetical protein
MHLVAPLDKHFPLLYAILKEHIADDVDYKVCFLICNQLYFRSFFVLSLRHITWYQLYFAC